MLLSETILFAKDFLSKNYCTFADIFGSLMRLIFILSVSDKRE